MAEWVWSVIPALVAAQSPLEVQPGFCTRLAAASGMKPAKPVDSRPAWEVDTLGGLGPLLFGGTSVMSMGVEPVGDATATAADYQRLRKACDPTDKGAVCAIDGPVLFHVGVKGRVVQISAAAGEHAQVHIRGTRISCPDVTR